MFSVALAAKSVDSDAARVLAAAQVVVPREQAAVHSLPIAQMDSDDSLEQAAVFPVRSVVHSLWSQIPQTMMDEPVGLAVRSRCILLILNVKQCQIRREPP